MGREAYLFSASTPPLQPSIAAAPLRPGPSLGQPTACLSPRMFATPPEPMFAANDPHHMEGADSKRRWIISSSVLYLLEHVFKMERFPSLHMRQRLAADLGVSTRQVRAMPRMPPSLAPSSPPSLLCAPDAGSHSRCRFCCGHSPRQRTQCCRANRRPPSLVPRLAGAGLVPEPAPARSQPLARVRGRQGRRVPQRRVVLAAPLPSSEPLRPGGRDDAGVDGAAGGTTADG